MNTLSWLEIMLFLSVFVGTLAYHFGFAMGKTSEEIDQEERLASMRRHPSNHLRAVKE